MLTRLRRKDGAVYDLEIEFVVSVKNYCSAVGKKRSPEFPLCGGFRKHVLDLISVRTGRDGCHRKVPSFK